MHKWIVSPLLAVMLSQVIALSDCHAAPPEVSGHKSAVQIFFETIWQEWFHLHSAAAHKGKRVRADIVFDPQHGAVTLNRSGDKPTKTVELPPGLKWHAFHISVHGVRELSFPVVLQRPNHYEPRSPQDDEEILIVGDARKTQMYFQIGSRVTGVKGGGSGGSHGTSKRNTISKMLLNFEFLMQARRDPRFRSEVSMLTRDSLRKQPHAALEVDDVRVQVKWEPIK